MNRSQIVEQDLALYHAQINADQDWETHVIQDEWWVAHAPSFYEKYYYSQRPTRPPENSKPTPRQNLITVTVKDEATHYVVSIGNLEPIVVKKTIGIGPSGYPAIQPGLLCVEHKILWPQSHPCPHIEAVQQDLQRTSRSQQLIQLEIPSQQ